MPSGGDPIPSLKESESDREVWIPGELGTQIDKIPAAPFRGFLDW